MPEAASAGNGLSVRVAQNHPVILDAEFTCAPGELLALVGPSGSGKSTILRYIAGLHRSAQGRVCCGGLIWYDSRSGVDLKPQHRRVGMVFQSYALFPHLTALENVMTSVSHLPRAECEQKARDWLARMHLTGLEARHPLQLSGGQQQRVAVARALAGEPSLLLLDEPFSAVDQVTRRKLQVELARLRSGLSIPIVLVTHDLNEARTLADRMSILHRGVTLQSGEPQVVMTRPASASVARLVELYNVFDGTVLLPSTSGAAGRLRWHERELEVTHCESFRAGSRVCWAIAPEFVVLHRRDRPSRGERENPLDGIVEECIALGDTTNITVRLQAPVRSTLSFSVPSHVARRNSVAPRGAIRISLLAEGIHLMPWEDLSRFG